MRLTIRLIQRIVLWGLLSVTVLFVSPFVYSSGYAADYFPADTWRTAAPEDVGMDARKLQDVYTYCAEPARYTRGYMIIKDGYIIDEAYFDYAGKDTPFGSYSIAKSIVSALTGIAIDKGLVHSLDDGIADYFPQIEDDGFDPQLKQISIRHLLTMTTGLEWAEDENPLTPLNDIFNLTFYVDDYIDYVLGKPVIDPPGSIWNYTSGAAILLSGIIENTSGILTADFAEQHLFTPLGIDSFSWSTDPSGRTSGSWGLSLTMREYAKLGYLYLKNGQWNGEQVIHPSWVTSSRIPADDHITHYGFSWWLADRYPGGAFKRIPEDTYMAVGLFQRYVIVIPSYNLVLVRIGDGLETGEAGWDTASFISRVVDAVNAPVPDCSRPPSPPAMGGPWGYEASAWPVFRWEALACAQWYQIFVWDSKRNTRLSKWVRSEEVTSGRTCALSLPTAGLPPGDYQWFIRAWSPSGYGQWSDGVDFTVETGSAEPVLIWPSGVTEDEPVVFVWNRVPNATWYNLWIDDNLGSRIFNQWFESSNISNAAECSVILGETEGIGPGKYTWYVQAWHKDGGRGPWSKGTFFEMN